MTVIEPSKIKKKVKSDFLALYVVDIVQCDGYENCRKHFNHRHKVSVEATFEERMTPVLAAAVNAGWEVDDSGVPPEFALAYCPDCLERLSVQKEKLKAKPKKTSTKSKKKSQDFIIDFFAT